MQASDSSQKIPYDEAESWLAKLGPGLVTGAADDDPSGIATYSQAGAKYGSNMLWTMLLTYPPMVAIQIISARIGRVSGHGLATNMRRFYPIWMLYSVVVLLVIANTINIAADLSAMGSAIELLIGGSERWYAAGFGVLSLALLAYVTVIFMVHISWTQVLRAVFILHLSWKADYVTTVVAVLGTTISVRTCSFGRLPRKSNS